MSAQPYPRYTPQQYLEQERAAEFKSEYIDGHIVAMAGASREHNLIVSNLVRDFGNKLVASPCETYSNDMRVRASSFKYAYPNVAVACDPQFEDRHLDVLLNPVLLIEVLSPSTEDKDRGWKFLSYRRMPSLTDYVMLSQERPHVEHYSRFGQDLWTLRDYEKLEDTLALPSLGIRIPLWAIYERVTFPAEPPAEDEQRRGE